MSKSGVLCGNTGYRLNQPERVLGLKSEELENMEETEVKRIICLANSRKLAGRCIAGREVVQERGGGTWIRPVSERESGEVSEYERQYRDGSDPKVLDIIDVPIKEHHPEGCQSENWLIDSEFYWEKNGVFPVHEIHTLTDPIESLWIDGISTHQGQNDKIPIASLSEVHSSLRLIQVEKMKIKVFAPGEAFGNSKRRVQGHFEHANQNYALWVTDPRYETKFLAKLDGDYQIGACFVTISLGEPFKGAMYKLIAAIIEFDDR